VSSSPVSSHNSCHNALDQVACRRVVLKKSQNGRTFVSVLFRADVALFHVRPLIGKFTFLVFAILATGLGYQDRAAARRPTCIEKQPAS
jgi:hypothetical protein